MDYFANLADCDDTNVILLKLTEQDGRMLQWNGERNESTASTVIHTYEDHRMAMAFAPVAIRDPKGIRMADVEVVSKSHPRCWNDLLNADFQLISEQINLYLMDQPKIERLLRLMKMLTGKDWFCAAWRK
jgi:hypothetical protein